MVRTTRLDADHRAPRRLAQTTIRQLVNAASHSSRRDPNIRLIEQPEYKRRWNTEPWESQLERALREWLLDRLESYFDFDGRMNDEEQADRPKLDIELTSVGQTGRYRAAGRRLSPGRRTVPGHPGVRR